MSGAKSGLRECLGKIGVARMFEQIPGCENVQAKSGMRECPGKIKHARLCGQNQGCENIWAKSGLRECPGKIGFFFVRMSGQNRVFFCGNVRAKSGFFFARISGQNVRV